MPAAESYVADVLTHKPDEQAVLGSRIGTPTVEAAAGERKVTIGVRPEDMELVSAGQGLSTVINLVEELGADAYVYGTADVNGQALDVIARVDGRKPPEKGATVAFAPKPGHLHLFSTTSGERLPT